MYTRQASFVGNDETLKCGGVFLPFNQDMSDKRITVSVATHLADSYFISATGMCLTTEAGPMEHDLVYGGVFLLAAFLEGKARELVYDLTDSRTQYFDQDFKTKFEASEADKKKRPFDRLSVVEKYQLMVALSGSPARGDLISLREIRGFVEVRNKLVHYDPERVTSSISPGDSHLDHDSRFSHFQGKFPLRSGLGTLNPLFPDKLVSRGFLAWAIFHTSDFIGSFLKTCQLESHGRKLLTHMTPLLSELEQIYVFDQKSGVVNKSTRPQP